MNLVIALLSTHGYLTAERIRANVAGYAEQPQRRGVLPDVRAGQERTARPRHPAGDRAGLARSTPTEGYRINRTPTRCPTST